MLICMYAGGYELAGAGIPVDAKLATAIIDKIWRCQ